MIDDPLDDELRGEGGHGEVEPLDPKGRDTEEHAGKGGRAAPAQHREDPVRARELAKDDRRGIGSDRHEGGVSDRDLTRAADEDVEPERAEGGDADEVEDAEPVFAPLPQGMITKTTKAITATAIFGSGVR